MHGKGGGGRVGRGWGGGGGGSTIRMIYERRVDNLFLIFFIYIYYYFLTLQNHTQDHRAISINSWREGYRGRINYTLFFRCVLAVHVGLVYQAGVRTGT